MGRSQSGLPSLTEIFECRVYQKQLLIKIPNMQIQSLFKNMVVYSDRKPGAHSEESTYSRFLPGILRQQQAGTMKRNDSEEVESSDYDTCPSDEGLSEEI